jgi:hypothetical protein
LEKELSLNAPEVVKEAITAILDILPKNPRKFKHYLRYLNSLHKGFLCRFGRNELDWKMLYIAQLIRIEFPELFKQLMQDDEMVEDLASGRVWDKQKDFARRAYNVEKKEEEPEWKKKLEEKTQGFEGINKDRFYELYQNLRESGGLTSPERVRNHLLVIEVPELMTWSEYYAFKDKLTNQTDKDVLIELRKFVSENQKNKDVECIREFLKGLVREYHEIWSGLIELHSQEEIKKQLVEVNKIERLCNLVAELDEIFTGFNPIFNKVTFDEWWERLSHWAYFVEPKELYSCHREQEKRLLSKIVHKNLSRVSEVAEWLRNKFNDHDPTGRVKQLKDLQVEIDGILSKKLAEDILGRFQRKDGIKEIWPSDAFISEKRILFKHDSFFHKAEIYDELKVIAGRAKDDIEVQKNFIEVLTLFLFYAVEHSGWVSPEEVRPLILKKEFFSIIWDAAVARPLNRRTVGSLEGNLDRLKAIITDDTYIKRPDWWTAFIKNL